MWMRPTSSIGQPQWISELSLIAFSETAGVSFNMVEDQTRIESSHRAISFQDLQEDLNKGVSVRFVPEWRGRR